MGRVSKRRLSDLYSTQVLDRGMVYEGYVLGVGDYIELSELCLLFGFDERYIRFLSLLFGVYVTNDGRFIEYSEFIADAMVFRRYYEDKPCGLFLEEIRFGYVNKQFRRKLDVKAGFRDSSYEPLLDGGIGNVLTYELKKDKILGVVLRDCGPYISRGS